MRIMRLQCTEACVALIFYDFAPSNTLKGALGVLTCLMQASNMVFFLNDQIFNDGLQMC